MENHNASFKAASPHNILDCWGTSDKWRSISSDSLDNKAKKKLLEEYYEEDGGLRLNEELFLDENNTYFELWENGKAIGLLSVFISRMWRGANEADYEEGDTPFLYIEPKAVFILEGYRGEGLGMDLAGSVSNHIAKNLVCDLASSFEKLKYNELDITVFADYDSSEGEMFVEKFAEAFSNESAFFGILKSIGIQSSLGLDVGY